MKRKCLMFGATFLLTTAAGFSQDSSKLPGRRHVKNNSDTLNSIVEPATGKGNPSHNPGTPHATVNSNTGTVIPNTTSGTLNSSVNPNTQFVIPIHKNKKRSNSNVAPDSGIIIPHNKQ